MEGDVPAPRPVSPKPGPSTEPEEKQNQAATGKNNNRIVRSKCFFTAAALVVK